MSIFSLKIAFIIIIIVVVVIVAILRLIATKFLHGIATRILRSWVVLRLPQQIQDGERRPY